MNIQELKTFFDSYNIRYVVTDEKISGLIFPPECELSDSDAWKLVEENDLKYVLDAELIVEKYPNWQQFKNILWGSPLFLKAYSTSNDKAWSLLLHTLESSSHNDQRLAAFKVAIADIRSGLTNDFTGEEINHFNQILADCDFNVTIE